MEGGGGDMWGHVCAIVYMAISGGQRVLQQFFPSTFKSVPGVELGSPDFKVLY